jgi:hypothetical protein
VKTFITNLKTQVDANKGPLDEPGWHFNHTDLNSGVGGKFIYTGFQRGESPPVTSLYYAAFDTSQSNPLAGWQWDGVDLNTGAGGKFIYMFWKTGEQRSPITSINYVVTSNSSPPYLQNYIPVGCDLNEGAGGPFIWGYYSTTVSEELKKTKINIAK